MSPNNPKGSTTMSMVDGVTVVVPATFELVTPYVLAEQRDWFEDEIRFIRRILRPGERALDIGANYGVYALSMAQVVGPTGRVWAFEPSSSTASFLAASVAANGFGHLTVLRYALSDTVGEGRLAVRSNTEFGTLIDAADETILTEPVSIKTLDSLTDLLGREDIAVVKIDVEGKEANVLAGGASFFAMHSPLVQYEVRENGVFHLELVKRLAAMGYTSYRLVPGLGVLVPFDPMEGTSDPFLLNLFACKEDRADALAAMNRLVRVTEAKPDAAALERIVAVAADPRYHWRSTLSQMPYAVPFFERWVANAASSAGTTLELPLALYAVSHDGSLSIADRWMALERSFMMLRELPWTNLRCSTFARVAGDYGARSTRTMVLGWLSSAIMNGERVSLEEEPFLAPGERFDALTPDASRAKWLIAGLHEEFERACTWSSFYTRSGSKQRLELMHRLGFAGPEMARRLALIEHCLRSASANP